MQNLTYHPKWDKTLSQHDRKRIEDSFHKLQHTRTKTIEITPLWSVINYRGELLATTLIHNASKQSLIFCNFVLRYSEHNTCIAEHSFTYDSLIIEPQSSMPWTFIFPVSSLKQEPALDSGMIEFIKN